MATKHQLRAESADQENHSIINYLFLGAIPSLVKEEIASIRLTGTYLQEETLARTSAFRGRRRARFTQTSAS